MEKKSSFGKWIIIIIIVLLLMFLSMIAAGILGLFFGISAVTADIEVDGSGNVALIEIKGVIITESTTGLFGREAQTSSTEIVERLEKIKKDNSIKAVIFEINSPGGSGVASDEIAQAIKSLNKTTVAYVREVGASGAYWVASAADHLIAHRLSFVGSIGVIGSYLEFSGLMDDYNVSYQRFVAGKYKDFGTPFRKPTDEERDLFQGKLDAFHRVFIQEVAENRNLSYQDVAKLATGFIYTGQEAIELGLVDELGGKEQAIAYVEQKENIKAHLIKYRKTLSIFERLGQLSSESSYNVGQGIGDSLKKTSDTPDLMFR